MSPGLNRARLKLIPAGARKREEPASPSNWITGSPERQDGGPEAWALAGNWAWLTSVLATSWLMTLTQHGTDQEVMPGELWGVAVVTVI